MSANTLNLVDANALVKNTYAKELNFAVPDDVKIYPNYKMREGQELQGGVYNMPMVLSLEQGITYAGPYDAVNMNSAIASEVKFAQVDGTQIIGRSVLPWATIARTGKTPNKFVSATEYIVRNLLMSSKRRGEWMFLYGGSSLATVSNVSGTDLTLSAADFAEGVWVGAKNTKIDIYDSSGVARLLGVTVNSVNIQTRVISVSLATGVVATDKIYFAGSVGKEANGAYTIMTKTSGTQFGLPLSSYPDLLESQQYPGSGSLTFAQLVAAARQAYPFVGEVGYDVYMNQKQWQALVNEAENARTFGDNEYTYKLLQRGNDSIKFHSVSGVMEVRASSFVKQSHVFGFPKNGTWCRVGARDIAIGSPMSDDAFYQMQDTTAVQAFTYGTWAPFCEKPAASFIITGLS